MQPIISLILPAYNVAEYIEACVNSCERQDLPADSYEIVIVNDGSTDTTPPIINTLAKRYPNIVILNQQNQGLSMARNNGFKVARGKYVWFVDSDDIITTNCLKSLIEVVERQNLDALVVGPSIPFVEQFPDSFNHTDSVSQVYNGVDFLLRSKRFVVGAWCYILRRDFWESNQFQFYPGIAYEDTQLMGYAISKADRVAALTQFSCYSYIQREGSIMNSKPNHKKLLSHAVITNTHIEYAQKERHPELSESFLSSASSSFIAGINMLLQMDCDKTLTEEYLSAIAIRPKRLFGSSFLKRSYQYVILNYPRTYLRLRKLIGK